MSQPEGKKREATLFGRLGGGGKRLSFEKGEGGRAKASSIPPARKTPEYTIQKPKAFASSIDYPEEKGRIEKKKKKTGLLHYLSQQKKNMARPLAPVGWGEGIWVVDRLR